MNRSVMQAENVVHFRFGWPVGMKLRLRPAQFLLAEYAHLGGCAVVVTTDAMMAPGPRQFVYLLQGRDERFSTERIHPQDMELIPDIDPVALEINQAVVNELPDWWFRTLKPKRQRQSGTLK